ncbi:MAG: hypothetical protein RIQ49_752 [Pseudomonadota bacterium]|jgi:PhzF family phenazine biosynthesis protein
MSTVSLRFSQVDVFAESSFRGNPLAVVHDADELSSAHMQQIASWTHLSETAFLMRSGDATADYKVRIFTPTTELPFAGHPTLGACAAWLAAGGVAKHQGFVVQDCAKGLVRLKRDLTPSSISRPVLRFDLAFEAPSLSIEPIEPEKRLAFCEALGVAERDLIDMARLDNGPIWYAFWIKSHETLMGLEPDHAKLARLGKIGIASLLTTKLKSSKPVIHEADPHVIPQIAVRAFAAAVGVNEDPVTGSLNAALAQWLMAKAYLPRHYQAHQGQRLGRDGLVDLKLDDADRLWVGGCSTIVIQGSIQVDALL